MEVNETRRLRQVEEENGRLKKILGGWPGLDLNFWVPHPSRFWKGGAVDVVTGTKSRCCRDFYASFGLLIGSSRIRFPVAANIALQRAGMKGGTPGSPTPAGGASLSTRCTLVCTGASRMRATG